MIQEISIGNFKSIKELKLELGQFNVLIGENGCGKTNILEAVAFGGAAAAGKLDNEFLSSRGIRVTNPETMRAAFENGTGSQDIYLKFIVDQNLPISFQLKNENKPYSGWEITDRDLSELELITSFSQNLKEQIEKQIENISDPRVLREAALFLEKAEQLSKRRTGKDKESRDAGNGRASYLFNQFKELTQFIIYSPENSTLRIFEQEGQVLPLGIKGEGLFKLLKNLLLAKDKKPIREIKKNLQLMDWFEDFELPKSSAPGEFILQIKDRFLTSRLNYFDQRSANEGFLFLLFYLCLFISRDTPEFFAIDNVEASFNPKLCVEVSKMLIRLAKEKKKQVIVTTQNPSILDGINLHDPGERLFVVKRNTLGHTVATRITAKPDSPPAVKLSEAWTRGYIGGLPKNF